MSVSNVRRNPILTTKKGEQLTDQRISVCIDCRRGIFKHHNYVFTSRGYVHKWCEDRLNVE